MPADYLSTAKALALPISPSGSPSPERSANRPPWSRRISGSSRRAQTVSPYTLASRTSSYKTKILSSAHQVQKKVVSAFQALPWWQRILAIILIILVNVGLILFLIYNEQIFQLLAEPAKKWHAVRGGWTILWLITFIAAFPPLIGYSTCVTISGFVYGFPNGWFIVSTATVAGSTASFIASRTVLSGYVHRLVGADKRFEALALTLKHDGLKILCMIRFCPLPYSISNAAMSTFSTVHPLSFALATAIASPKLLIHVFIGSRMALIGEGGSEGHSLDPATKALNYTAIILGSILGATVGWIIYQRTMARAKQLEVEELEAGNADPLGNAIPNEPARERAYSDVTEDDNMMNDDDISLWDTTEERIEDRDPHYRDFTDDDDDVFARGDVSDEDPAVRQKKRKGTI